MTRMPPVADDPCRDCENRGRPLDRFPCLGCIAGVRGVPLPVSLEKPEAKRKEVA